MSGVENIFVNLIDSPASDLPENKFSNIINCGPASKWVSPKAQAKAKAKARGPFSFTFKTEDMCQLRKIEWQDKGDDSGVAEMVLEMHTNQRWHQLSKWKASRVSARQEHEFPVDQVAYGNHWKMTFVRTHSGAAEHMIVQRVRFFKNVLPREEGFDEDDYACNLNTKMWEDKKFTDVSLTCDGETFHAHRCVLAAASPVFLKMLETNMKEAQTHEILIEDDSSAAQSKQW